MFGNLLREKRAIQATAWGVWPGDSDQYGTPAGSTIAGTVGVRNSLQLLTVYGCNRFICEGISTLPVDTYRSTSAPPGSALPGVAPKSRPVETPKPRWLEEPTVDLDVVGWLTQILTSLLLAGNAYLLRDFDGSPGGPRYLIPLDPTKVNVTREAGRKVFVVGANRYTTADILHIPGVMFPGSDVGLSPVEAARQTIGAGFAITDFANGFFANGGTYGGVIEDPGGLDPEKAKETARIWARLHSGTRKAHLPGVLQGGATWKPTAVSNEQAQFLQTRGFTAAEIAGQMFLIDPSELGIPIPSGGNLTYANLEQRNQRKAQVTFLPWIVRIERALSNELPRPRFLKFNLEGLLRGDLDARFKAHAVGIQNHFLLPNEARDIEDMPPLADGDTWPPPVAAKV